MLIINFFALNFTNIGIEGERVSSSLNEKTSLPWGWEGVLENKQGETRVERGGQNLGILSERTF